MGWKRGLGITAVVVVAGVAAVAAFGRFEYAPMPVQSALVNPERRPDTVAYDVLGRSVGHAEAERLMATGEGRAFLSPANGAIRVDEDFLALGREAFYRETFGNEVWATDVLGIIDGAMTPLSVVRGVLATGGAGTSDLKIRLAKPLRLGDRVLEAGTEVSTGLDIPRGGLFPLGIKVIYDRGALRVGITCAACHSTVDPDSGRVIEGAPNADIRIGLMLAMASNSASYFTHTDVHPDRVPDPEEFEAAVNAVFAAWPPGNFDPTVDLVANPTNIPDSFTAYDHPFGWTGFAAIGPFRGLNVLNNNVHALNTDSTAQADHAPILFGMDRERYIATILRNAPGADFRYDPADGRLPSEVLAAADPNPGTPGIIRMVPMPGYPAADYLTSDGLIVSVPGYPAWHHISAISAFQDSLLPPQQVAASAATVAEGRQVFEAAGCASCHDGPGYTNHRVLPAAEVGADPSRAAALSDTEKALAPPRLYATDTPVPLPPQPHTIPIEPEGDALEQLRLGWAHGDTEGGYKVKGLVGLAWSAPYLHEGGVAVGPDPERHLGLPGTLLAGVPVHPGNSLRALVDRSLRARVVAANRAEPSLAAVSTQGAGHGHWVDEEAGFSLAQQDALIAYLLSLTRPDETEGEDAPQASTAP
ncbi:hypothetical protein [Azospirillum halopraeferens]|uniref:hypothetical protein n=1 Tax=Azospirillum halopraeferens TaxID=34010 RepID=UPI000411B563|nr:hypothetical protein [Azospirillum halopraeferens]